MTSTQSLDSRRPLFLREMVGNRMLIQRLSQQMKGGTVPQRAFFYGPTGAGKTTIARTLARHFFCRSRVGIGDPCGQCDRCLVNDLDSIAGCTLLTASRLEDAWAWWKAEGPSLLLSPYQAFILDEAQDLSELHQKWFYDQLESARALVIFATTHKNAIKDALLNRFGANVYEMQRPTLAEALELLYKTCEKLNVQATRERLTRVVELYSFDLRKCVDFVYTVRDQAPEGVVTDEFIDSVFGITPASHTDAKPPQRRSTKL